MAAPRLLLPAAIALGAALLAPATITLAAALLAPAAWPAAQQLPWQSSADKDAPAVRYEFPGQIAIPANKPSVVEMHFRIREGLHINSHAPLEKSLIRTDLVVVEPAGVKVTGVDFPQGSDYTLRALPGEKLSVYTGELVLQAHLSARPGEHLVQAALRYQACDTDSCYPPRTAQVALSVVAR